MTSIPPVIIHTPRLRLRPLEAKDQAWFVATSIDPIVMRHVGGAMSKEAAEALFSAIIQGTRARVFGTWCAEYDGVVIGHGALLREGDELEIGYILPRSSWGKGYATEIARSLSDYAFKHLGRERVFATVDADHPPSLRVLQKIGMSILERVEAPEGASLRCALDQKGD